MKSEDEVRTLKDAIKSILDKYNKDLNSYKVLDAVHAAFQWVLDEEDEITVEGDDA